MRHMVKAEDVLVIAIIIVCAVYGNGEGSVWMIIEHVEKTPNESS